MAAYRAACASSDQNGDRRRSADDVLARAGNSPEFRNRAGFRSLDKESQLIPVPNSGNDSFNTRQVCCG